MSINYNLIFLLHTSIQMSYEKCIKLIFLFFLNIISIFILKRIEGEKRINKQRKEKGQGPRVSFSYNRIFIILIYPFPSLSFFLFLWCSLSQTHKTKSLWGGGRRRSPLPPKIVLVGHVPPCPPLCTPLLPWELFQLMIYHF